MCGKTYNLDEVPPTVRPSTLWVWAAGSEATAEQIDAFIILLARRAQVPASAIREAQRRVQGNMRVNGSVALATTDDIARKLYALAEESLC